MHQTDHFACTSPNVLVMGRTYIIPKLASSLPKMYIIRCKRGVCTKALFGIALALNKKSMDFLELGIYGLWRVADMLSAFYMTYSFIVY